MECKNFITFSISQFEKCLKFKCVDQNFPYIHMVDKYCSLTFKNCILSAFDNLEMFLKVNLRFYFYKLTMEYLQQLLNLNLFYVY